MCAWILFALAFAYAHHLLLCDRNLTEISATFGSFIYLYLHTLVRLHHIKSPGYILYHWSSFHHVVLLDCLLVFAICFLFHFCVLHLRDIVGYLLISPGPMGADVPFWFHLVLVLTFSGPGAKLKVDANMGFLVKT